MLQLDDLKILLCLLMMSFHQCLTLFDIEQEAWLTPDLWTSKLGVLDNRIQTCQLRQARPRRKDPGRKEKSGWAEKSIMAWYHPSMCCIFNTGKQLGVGHWGFSFSMQAVSAMRCQSSIDKALHHMGLWNLIGVVHSWIWTTRQALPHASKNVAG